MGDKYNCNYCGKVFNSSNGYMCNERYDKVICKDCVNLHSDLIHNNKDRLIFECENCHEHKYRYRLQKIVETISEEKAIDILATFNIRHVNGKKILNEYELLKTQNPPKSSINKNI
jgi:hypothetical protein